MKKLLRECISLFIVVSKEKKLIIAITTFTILKEILVLASFWVQRNKFSKKIRECVTRRRISLDRNQIQSIKCWTNWDSNLCLCWKNNLIFVDFCMKSYTSQEEVSRN